MDLSKFLLNSATLALGGTVIVVVAYYMVRNDILTFLSARKKMPIGDHRNDLLHLRLQAHERMIIFVDRINPANLLLRLHQPGIEVGTLQAMAINEIKTEFQHNITQQLYLDPQTWSVMLKLKDDTIAMINNAVKNLPAEASGTDLSKKVLTHLSDMNDNPYELTIGLIKQDIHRMF